MRIFKDSGTNAILSEIDLLYEYIETLKSGNYLVSELSFDTYMSNSHNGDLVLFMII